MMGEYEVKEAQGVFIPEDPSSSKSDNKNNNSSSDNNKHETPVHVSTIEVGFDDEPAFVKGEPQPPEYQDIWFARAFYVQLIGVMVAAVVYVPAIFQDNSSDDVGGGSSRNSSASSSSNYTWSPFFVMSLVAVLFLASMGSTLFLFSLMTKFADRAVTFSFFVAPVLLVVFAAIFCVLGGQEGVTLGAHMMFIALIFALVSACVYHAFRKKIPFAASTLKAALSALEFNKGLLLLSVGSLLVAFAWSALWLSTLVGIFVSANAKGEVKCLELYPTQTDIYDSSEMCDIHPPNGLAILFLIVSFYWTHQVITNCMHCTTAGTVGSWWFSGFGDPTLCSQDVTDSFTRTMTYSFGSICCGSLVVAILQTLEAMARQARGNRHGQLIACLLECILHCLRRWFEYFNSWAFVYVALYGYDYRTAGKNVMRLVEQRGWSSFIADRLVFRVLYSTKLAVGICCGGVAAMVDIFAGPLFPSLDDDNTTTTGDGDTDPIFASHVLSFYVGALVGLITSSVSLFVIESAVRAVIVCFAESPADFQEHHPQLCEQMRAGWAAAYPDVWNSGDYNERFASAAVICYDDAPCSSDDPLQSHQTSKSAGTKGYSC